MPLVAPDDDATRFRAVWLGPDGYTLPFRARYVSWALWFALQIALTVLFAAVPGIGIGPALLWAFAFSVLATRVTMLLVDADLPLAAVPSVLAAEVAAFSRREPDQTYGVSVAGVRIRSLTGTTETP